MSKKATGLWSFVSICVIAVLAVSCTKFETEESTNSEYVFGFSPQARLVGNTTFSTYTSNDITGVFLANSRFFAAVGPYDDFISSTDGLTWTQPIYATSFAGMVTKDIFSYLGKYYVLSRDTTNTYLRTSSYAGTGYALEQVVASFRGNSLAISGTTFVLVGSDAAGTALKIYTSAAGVGYTARTPDTGGTGTTFNKVIYANGLFVAVGNNGEIQTSTVGTVWTSRTPAGGFTGTFTDITYGNGLFVAVGYTAGSAAVIQTSPDGIAWTSQTSALTAELYGVAFNDSAFLAVGTDGIQRSTTALSWAAVTVAGSYTGVFSGVKCTTTLCVAAGEDGELQYSVNTTAWSQGVGPVMMSAASSINGIGASSTTIVAVGTGGMVNSSPNGRGSWTQRAFAGPITTDMNAVAYGSSAVGFVAVGDSAAIQTSTAGTAWTARTAGGGFTGDLTAVTYSSGLAKYIAVGASGNVQSSANGTAWTSATVGATNYTGVAASPTLAVIVGPSAAIQTSPNLTAWTARTAGSAYAGDFNAVVYGESLFVAVGDSGEIQSSVDGITWIKRTVTGLGTTDLFGAAYNKGFFYAVGEANTVVRSEDGLTWEIMDNYDAATEDLKCIGGNSYGMVVGLATYGQILSGYLD